MKVAISVIGKFHSFDLAREMHARDALAGIFTGYPRFKLRHEGVPSHLIHSFPYFQAPYMAFARLGLPGARAMRAMENVSQVSFDGYTAARLPLCDVFVGLSGAGLKSGRAAKRRHGARYVCDRGSSHIRYQDRVLHEEHDRWGLPFDGIDPRAIEREEAEYNEADCITVPSQFALESFVGEGVPRRKLRKLPYGVSLSRFLPTSLPRGDRFDVLFVGGLTLRKGIPYLLRAYRRLRHPRKSLTFAGGGGQELIAAMKRAGLWADDIVLKGHVPQMELKELMSRSHVMVLPSVEEGLALVQAQAMACGCVVIASEHTGARDLFDDVREGYIVPIRDSDALAERMQRLADDPHLRTEMSSRAAERVRVLGGWRTYGDSAARIYQETCERKRTLSDYSEPLNREAPVDA